MRDFTREIDEGRMAIIAHNTLTPMRRYRGDARTELDPRIMRIWNLHEGSGSDATDTIPTCLACKAQAQDISPCAVCGMCWHEECILAAVGAAEEESIRIGWHGHKTS